MKPLTSAQLGVCSWSMKSTSAADLADKVASLGLTRVQLALNPHRNDPGAWDGVDAALSAKGATIVSGMFGAAGENYSTLESIRRTGGVVPDEHWDATWAYAQDAAKTARKLGLALVSTHIGFVPHDTSDPTYATLRGRVVQIARCFADHGLTLLFETGQEDADTLNRFLDDLAANGAANTGVNFDPANMILYGMGDPVASLKKLMPRVRQIHIKDALPTATPGTWGKEVPIGEGAVDWPAFLAVLADADFAGSLVIEREAGSERMADIRKAVERISVQL